VQQVALADGSLMALAVGDRRFKILDITVEEDGLARAQIEWLTLDPIVEIPDNFTEIAASFAQCGDELTEAGSLAWRLAEALPLSLTEQQQLLEENDPQKRLNQVSAWLLAHPSDYI
jgi:hypothetical protein